MAEPTKFIRWKSGRYKRSQVTHKIYWSNLIETNHLRFKETCMKIWNTEANKISTSSGMVIEKFLQEYYDCPEVKLVQVWQGRDHKRNEWYCCYCFGVPSGHEYTAFKTGRNEE